MRFGGTQTPLGGILLKLTHFSLYVWSVCSGDPGAFLANEDWLGPSIREVLSLCMSIGSLSQPMFLL